MTQYRVVTTWQPNYDPDRENLAYVVQKRRWFLGWCAISDKYSDHRKAEAYMRFLIFGPQVVAEGKSP